VRRRRWLTTLGLAGILSVLVAPIIVLVIGLRIRAVSSLFGDGVLQTLAMLLVFGLAQFGVLFLAVGLITGLLGAFSATGGLLVRVSTVLVPLVLFPMAAVSAIVWSSSGRVPLIQDTTPYFIGAFPAGLFVGVSTLLFSLRASSGTALTEGAA